MARITKSQLQAKLENTVKELESEQEKSEKMRGAISIKDDIIQSLDSQKESLRASRWIIGGAGFVAGGLLGIAMGFNGSSKIAQQFEKNGTVPANAVIEERLQISELYNLDRFDGQGILRLSPKYSGDQIRQALDIDGHSGINTLKSLEPYFGNNARHPVPIEYFLDAVMHYNSDNTAHRRAMELMSDWHENRYSPTVTLQDLAQLYNTFGEEKVENMPEKVNKVQSIIFPSVSIGNSRKTLTGIETVEMVLAKDFENQLEEICEYAKNFVTLEDMRVYRNSEYEAATVLETLKTLSKTGQTYDPREVLTIIAQKQL